MSENTTIEGKPERVSITTRNPSRRAAARAKNSRPISNRSNAIGEPRCRLYDRDQVESALVPPRLPGRLIPKDAERITEKVNAAADPHGFSIHLEWPSARVRKPIEHLFAYRIDHGISFSDPDVEHSLGRHDSPPSKCGQYAAAPRSMSRKRTGLTLPPLWLRSREFVFPTTRYASSHQLQGHRPAHWQSLPIRWLDTNRAAAQRDRCAFQSKEPRQAVLVLRPVCPPRENS